MPRCYAAPRGRHHRLALARAKRIELLVLDVDGVMTDGGIVIDADAGVAKRFHVHDGLGIKVAQAAGIEVAVISGLESPAVAARIRELGIVEYHPGIRRKVPVLEGILARLGLAPFQAAYLGDDWVDAAPMERVGLPMAVADAQPEIRDRALWRSRFAGGHGAVREAIRFLLAARGRLDEALGWFLD